jgi:5-methylcytosine-specific restriction endonuclease McrA
MPAKNPDGSRNYSAEKPYLKKTVDDRVARNRARREAIKEGKVKVGDSKEIDHIKPLSKGGSGAKSNTRVVSREANRKKYNKGGK